MRSRHMLLVAVITLSGSIGSLHTQSITWTGRPNNAQYNFMVAFIANLGNIDENGSRLVQASDYPLAFMWQRSLGWQQIGGFGYNCADISGDGSIIVGGTPTGNHSMPALYYHASATWQPLGLLSGFSSGGAFCISRDGNTVAGSLGYSSTRGSEERPFMYRGGTYTLLPIPDGARLVYAVGISPEGEVIVGTAAYEDTVPVHALRWDSHGRMTILDTPGSNWRAWATDASGAGEVIVGGGVANDVYKPLIWRNGTVAVLPTGDSVLGFAHRTTQTGQVITGTVAIGSESWNAVRWGPCGLENLNTVYARLLGTDEILLTAHALSRSGRYIAGLGSRDRGNTVEMYVLDTNRCWDPAGNVNADCCVDDADLLQVLFDFGNTGIGRPTDLNCDGIVDDADLLIVLFNFGQGCQ